MRTASHPYNNRHRQAPGTHTDKQAVRTIGGEQCLLSSCTLRVPSTRTKLAVLLLEDFSVLILQCVSARIHTSKLNIFSQTIKVSDCFLQYSVFIWQSYTLKMPTHVRVKFIYKKRGVDCSTPQCEIGGLTHNLLD